MAELSFKVLTYQNWLQPDPVLEFSQVIGGGSAIPGDKIVTIVMQPQLSSRVPDEVRGLYEVARGALCYGFFFYPLYTLAAEQLFRVAETALSRKCKDVGAPRLRNFHDKLEFLLKERIISESQGDRWHAVRSLRNRASHPTFQEIWSPGMAMDALWLVAELSNELFEAERNSGDRR